MSFNNSLYRYKFHGTKLSIKPSSTQTLKSLQLNTPEQWLSFNQGEVLSEGTTTCIKVTLPNNKKVIYFKRYHYTKNRWEFFLRRSKPANEYINYQRFKQLGIPTLKTIALCEKRTWGRLDFACIVTEEVKNTVQLDDFFMNTLPNLSSKERQCVLQEISQKLFSQIKTAHAAGVFHLDLKWRNILIQTKNGSYTPVWIDCPRGLQRKYLNYRLRVADLSGLTRKALSFFTAPHLYRMLYLYLEPNAAKAEARKMFFDIAKHLGRRPPKKLAP